MVVECGKLTGVIADRDMWQAFSPKVGAVAETSAVK